MTSVELVIRQPLQATALLSERRRAVTGAGPDEPPDTNGPVSELLSVTTSQIRGCKHPIKASVEVFGDLVVMDEETSIR